MQFLILISIVFGMTWSQLAAVALTTSVINTETAATFEPPGEPAPKDSDGTIR